MSDRHQGFTLLEVMVALVIFAIAALALLRAQNSQLSTDQHLEEKTLAHWVALNHLADLRLQKTFPEIGQGEATAKMAGREWLISSKVQATPTQNVRLLIISVAPKAEGNADFGKKPDPVTTITGFLPRAQNDTASNPAS
ncbi:MAG: type II secretion system minor pseudopilin GspI [Moraxellaceae bacterium]